MSNSAGRTGPTGRGHAAAMTRSTKGEPRPTPAEEALALVALTLMSPPQVAALQRIVDAPKNARAAGPMPDALAEAPRAFGPLFDAEATGLRLSDPALRPAFRAALARYRQADDPEARIRSALIEGRMDEALAVLAASGGAFLSMIHGLERAREVARLFPEGDDARPAEVMVLDVVNAMKSGQLVRADVLVERIVGRRRLPPLGDDQSQIDDRLATFRFVKAIYADQTIDEAGLTQAYRTLARLPPTATIEAGLLHHVTLDVYLRLGQWAAAGEAAQRALFHFERAGANGLAFYVHLYQAIIDLARGEVAAAGGAIDRAARLMDQATELTGNDNLLLVSLRLIQQYEAGEPDGWVTHLMTAAEPIPVGELWPAVAEPILAYGRRALGAFATHAAAIAWVRRWRVHQRRSDRFERMISVEEARALQAARRFQEADEILERLGTAEASAPQAIAALAASLELRPRAPDLAGSLDALARRAELAVRHLAEVELLRARAALARGNEDEAARALARLVDLAPPDRFGTFYRENQSALAECTSSRALRAVLRRRPQLARRLSDAIADHPPATPPSAAGLSRQERRVLALLAEGLPNKAIARRLGLATPTVKFHLTRLYARLGARNRREAVAKALSQGLIPA
jgi:ATP/maltotriose-dependent transcriptional regulator MalT